MRVAASSLPVRVVSYGTEKVDSAKALPEAIDHASRFGIDLKDHRARSLEGVDLSGVDLVIGFELAHVAAAVVEASAPYDRTFTLLELVSLLDLIDGELPEDPIGRAQAAVASANTLRSTTDVYVPEHQLRDPVGGPAEVFENTADRLQSSTRTLVDRLFGVSPHRLPQI